MSLHPVIPDSLIPEPLKRPLVFGDTEQIKALGDLDIKIRDLAKEEEDRANGVLKYYNVTIEVTGEISVEILAKDEDAACDKALEDFSIHDVDIDVDDVIAREIKP